MITRPETETRLREFYKGTSVLVTGSSGFVGTALINRLVDLGANVYTFDRRDGYDVCDASILQECVMTATPAVVFHLAALTEVRDSYARPLDYITTNVSGTLNLLSACRKLTEPTHFVYGSSDKVYGNQLTVRRESDPLEGNSDIYSFSKKVADELVQLYTENYRTWSTIVRPGNIYGPGQTNKTTLITRTIDLLSKGESPVIYGGSRYSVREWVYIDDAVDAYVLLGSAIQSTTRGRASVYNVGSHQRFSVEAIVGKLLTLFGHSVFDFTLEADSTPQTEAQKIVCHKFMHQFPEWSTIGFEEGLKRTVEWQTRGAIR